MKAMKAMKAMAAMAMKARKKEPISAHLSKRHAFFGKIDKSKSGLKKSDLVQNKHGRVVSKKKHSLGKLTLDCSSSEGPQGTQDQGLFSYQEGHPTLHKGQGALQPVSSKSMSNLLQTWGFLRLSSAGASVLESFGINDEGCT